MLFYTVDFKHNKSFAKQGFVSLLIQNGCKFAALVKLLQYIPELITYEALEPDVTTQGELAFVHSLIM